nr:PIG-L family deacetylase [Salsipaludibacter albus]
MLAVHPHPDDESIAVGGSLVRYGRAGTSTHVVTCTGGEAGDNLAGIDLGDRPMDEVRRDEMAAAVEVLGLASHTWLGYRDSGMVGTPENDHPDAFTNADLDEAATRLAEVVRRLRPDVVVSDDERGTYGHPDHVMSHRVTGRAVELAADPQADVEGTPHRVGLHVAHTISREEVQQMHDELRSRGLVSPFDDDQVASFGTPSEQILVVVDVREELAAKQEAMLAHRSQIAEDSAFFNIPDELVGRSFGSESFVLVSSARALDDADRSALATDLFGVVLTPGDGSSGSVS